MRAIDNFTGFEQRSVPTRHGRISVRLRQGSGPALILLHGNSFSGDSFAKFVIDPALAGIPLIIPDLPGHGLSDDAPGPARTYHYSGLGDCITELTAALHLQTYAIFGWSLGGQIAIEMLDRAPGLIGVATYGSAVVQRGPLGMMTGFHFTRALLLAGKSAMGERDAAQFAELCCGQTTDRSTVHAIMRVDPVFRPHLSRSALLGKDRDQRNIIAETSTPVCLMLGDIDPFIRSDTFAKVSGASIFGGQPLVIKDAGHSPFSSAKPEIIQNLMQFYSHAIEQAKLPRLLPLRMAS